MGEGKFTSMNNVSAQEHASSKNRHIFNFKVMLCVTLSCERVCPEGGGEVTPYNGLYGEAPPERGTSFSLKVYKRVRISLVEVYKRVGKSVI